MATSSCSRMLKVRSSEGDEFEIDETAAMVSELLKKMIEKGLSDEPITLPNVTGEVLSHVIGYCNKHSPEVEIRKWDADFVDLDMQTLYELRLAAIHMDINSLSLLLTDAIVAASRWVRLEREKLVHEGLLEEINHAQENTEIYVVRLLAYVHEGDGRIHYAIRREYQEETKGGSGH